MATTFHLRIALLAFAASVVLAGCADKPRRGSPATVPADSRAQPSPSPHHGPGTKPRAETAVHALPDTTGIPACDDYLASYKACHRAAGIFAAGQLENRYQAMRTSLLRDSQDPDIRPQLDTRCNSLASQLRQALHGKACATEPAAASTSPR